MALPVLTKTWQFNVNNTAGNTGVLSEDGRQLYLNMKNLMKTGVAMNPWQVRGSSNNSTAAPVGDLVDRWVTTGDVGVGSGTNGAWIVLRQTGIASSFEILMHRNDPGGNHTTCHFYCSPTAGFTGGSVGARPTATDEITLWSNNLSLGAAPSTWRLHYMQSTDGQCNRMVVCKNGQSQMIMFLDKPGNATTGWTSPSVSIVYQQIIASVATYTNFYNTNANLQGRIASVNTGFYGSCETLNGGALGQKLTFANDFDSNFPIIPIGLEVSVTGGRGRQGTLQDIWYGSTAVSEGANYPGDASRQFIQFGHIVLPWNGSIPLLT